MQTLEVIPGDNAVTVKKAFRSKIKKHHPDTATTPEDADRARTLIEAYEAFKKGVPKYQSPNLDRNSGLYHRANQYRANKSTTIKARTTENIGKETGQRLYEEIFAKRSQNLKQSFKSKNFAESWENISDLIWGDCEETMPYGENVSIREIPGIREPINTRINIPFEQLIENEPTSFDIDIKFQDSKNMLNTAEGNLKDIVAYFDDARSAKFTKNWMKEYVLALTQVQIRFRDVSRRHPAFSARSLRRVRQIGELISEIKSSVY